MIDLVECEVARQTKLVSHSSSLFQVSGQPEPVSAGPDVSGVSLAGGGEMRWDQGSRDPSTAPDISTEHTQPEQRACAIYVRSILNIKQLIVNSGTYFYFYGGISFVELGLDS